MNCTTNFNCTLLLVANVYVISMYIPLYIVEGNTGTLRLTLNPPEESDAGLYTCSLAINSTKNASVFLRVIGKLHPCVP